MTVFEFSQNNKIEGSNDALAFDNTSENILAPQKAADAGWTATKRLPQAEETFILAYPAYEDKIVINPASND